MGTHPIFESDFDCLTDLNRPKNMPAAAPAPQAVQVYGRKKTANAVATCKSGKGLIKVNGKPLEQIEPKALQFKITATSFRLEFKCTSYSKHHHDCIVNMHQKRLHESVANQPAPCKVLSMAS